MRTHLKILLLLLICVSAKAQSPQPSGLPAPYSTGYYRIGWLQSDSGSITATRDTNFVPKFQGTQILWMHSGVDTAIWMRIGSRWVKQLRAYPLDIINTLGFTPISRSSISATSPILYDNITGIFSCPSCGTGSGGITQLTGAVLAGPGTGSVSARLAKVNTTTPTFGTQDSVAVFITDTTGLLFNTKVGNVRILIAESQVVNLTADLGARQTLLSNNGSGFRVFSPSLPGIKTLFCAGCTLDSTSHAGALTITVPSGVPAGSNTQVQYNNSGAFGASANFTFNSGSNNLCVGCSTSTTGSITLGGSSGLGVISTNASPLQFIGDSILLKTSPIGTVTINTNNIDRFRVQTNGTAFFYSLSVSSDTTANKPLYINTTTHEIGQLTNWPGSGGGGTQTLTYSRAATADTIAISGGNKIALLPATTSLAGLLDTSRARYIDSLKGGLKKDTIHVITSTGTGLPTVFGDGVTNNLYNWKIKQGTNITLTANADTTITISSNVLTNPMTTTQDIIVATTAGAPARLGVGANNQILTVVSGNVTWANPSSAVNSVAAANTSLTITPTTGTVLANINVGNTNSWTVLQNFTTLTASSTVTLTGTTNPGNTLGSKFQVVGQDTTTGIIYHRQAQFLDTTGLNNTNGWIPYWDVTAQNFKMEAPPATAAPPNIGSGFRVYSPQTPGLRTLFCSGCTLDSTTNTNALTITVTGGGGGTPGGANTNLQFNNSGAFGGSANLTWNGTVLSTTGLTATSTVTFNGGVTYTAGGSTFDVIVQDTSSGKLWRQPYYQFDTTGYSAGATYVTYNGTKLTVSPTAAVLYTWANAVATGNYTVATANGILLADLTSQANRNVVLPSSPTGNQTYLVLSNINASGNSWIFTNATVKDKSNNTITTLSNSQTYMLIWDNVNSVYRITN